MNKAIIYKKQDKLMIHPLSQTTAGFWVMSEPFTVIEDNVEKEAVITAIFSALTNSLTNVPMPTNWKEFQKQLLTKAKVKSLKEFHVGCLACHVEQVEDAISLVPTRNLGYKEGFEEILDQKIVFSKKENTNDIWNALQEALSRCK